MSMDFTVLRRTPEGARVCMLVEETETQMGGERGDRGKGSEEREHWNKT